MTDWDTEMVMDGRAVLRLVEEERMRGEEDISVRIVNSPTKGTEVRVTDPVTGGQKGSKLARFALIPWEFLWALAELFGRGAFKYADRNWELGYDWSLSKDAMDRHFNLWLSGERYDTETGVHHLIAVAWHVCALFIYDIRGLGTDNITDPGRGVKRQHPISRVEELMPKGEKQ